jgi:NhaP-type Na+/H+ or K+/H+ antiporter
LKIDCSKLSNKGDLAALIAMILTVGLVGFAIYLAVMDYSFAAGFVVAIIICKWKAWIFDPIDNWLDLTSSPS